MGRPTFGEEGVKGFKSRRSGQKHSGQEEEQLPGVFFVRHVNPIVCKNSLDHRKSQWGPLKTPCIKKGTTLMTFAFRKLGSSPKHPNFECGPVISSEGKFHCLDCAPLFHPPNTSLPNTS